MLLGISWLHLEKELMESDKSKESKTQSLYNTRKSMRTNNQVTNQSSICCMTLSKFSFQFLHFCSLSWLGYFRALIPLKLMSQTGHEVLCPWLTLLSTKTKQNLRFKESVKILFFPNVITFSLNTKVEIFVLKSTDVRVHKELPVHEGMRVGQARTELGRTPATARLASQGSSSQAPKAMKSMTQTQSLGSGN